MHQFVSLAEIPHIAPSVRINFIQRPKRRTVQIASALFSVYSTCAQMAGRTSGRGVIVHLLANRGLMRELNGRGDTHKTECQTRLINNFHILPPPEPLERDGTSILGFNGTISSAGIPSGALYHHVLRDGRDGVVPGPSASALHTYVCLLCATFRWRGKCSVV